jgi:hypothetical protein
VGRLQRRQAEPVEVRFRAEEPGELCAWMRRLTDGGGWVNIAPLVDEADLPPLRSPLAALVAARGPEVPLATWVPGREGRRGRVPASVGLQHAAGPRAAALLADRGVPVPAGWRVVQDHPRRGLAAELPEGVAPEDVVGWLLAAATALSAVPLSGWWQATVHRSR